LELARQIGELKDRLGIPLRNFRVEAQVHTRFEEASRFLGLESSLGHDLALFLIEKAVEEQATARDAVYRGDALDTFIVGGKGGMGQWIARFLLGQGHRVRVFDPTSGDCLGDEVDSLAAAGDADIVFVAVPMSACPGVLSEIATRRPTGVIAEICSLKTHLGAVKENLRRGGLRVVSFHPMFGPHIRMLSGRTIVFCTDGQSEDIALVRNLFAETSANLVDMDEAEHDRRMALVLGMSHLINLVYSRAVQLSGSSATDLAEVAGVTFGKQMKTSREVVGENPRLYYEIQALGGFTPFIGDLLHRAVDEWQEVVADGNLERFTTVMKGCRGYLAEANEGDSGQ
ncbi:MAG: prephenate dehydrogenase/arogenate dehydrogenase family protein, partial [Acidimicrobiia bacterium]